MSSIDVGRKTNVMTSAERHAAERGREVERAAKVYQDAVERGLPPIATVMDRVGLSRATAIRRIKAARDTGALPDAARPIYGSKLAAVARAMNVDPERLRDAILEHADGDLRVQPREARNG